jgi:uncharacterized protein (UPF0218 family)
MMRRSVILGVVLAAALVLPVAVGAHEGHAHKVMGTVTARNGNQVEVKTPAGKAVTVVLTDKTTFARGKQKVDGTLVKAGERIVVDVLGEKDMTAKAVVLAVPTATTVKK